MTLQKLKLSMAHMSPALPSADAPSRSMQVFLEILLKAVNRRGANNSPVH